MRKGNNTRVLQPTCSIACLILQFCERKLYPEIMRMNIYVLQNALEINKEKYLQDNQSIL